MRLTAAAAFAAEQQVTANLDKSLKWRENPSNDVLRLHAKETGAKRSIAGYKHKGKERVNNPPVGLVTPETDPDVHLEKKLGGTLVLNRGEGCA